MPVAADLATANALQLLEDDLAALEARVVTLENAPGSGGAATGTPGVVEFDQFSGTDDQKMTAALSYAAAQSRIPYIRMPARIVTLNQGGRVPFDGMKIIGPPGCGSTAKNPQINYAGGSPGVNHIIRLNMGTGTSSLFRSTAELYGVFLGGLVFHSPGRTAQLWSQTAGTLYSCEFNSLSMFGMKGVMGNTNENCLITGVQFSGYWLCNGHMGGDLQFHMGGSDSELWVGGFLNIEGASGTGQFQMHLDGLSKTNVGKIYCTSWQGWRGIRISGPSRGLSLWGTVSEGRNESNPCHGSTVRIEGGQVYMAGFWLAHAMSNPSGFAGVGPAGNSGVVHVTGGDVLIARPYYWKANAVAESVPLVYASGGRVEVRNAAISGGTWSGLPRVDAAGGTVVADSTVTVI